VGKIIIPCYIERISVPINESVAFDLEAGKHTKQNNSAIVEFAEELPFPVANPHENKGNDFPVAKVIMPPPCPVPDVPPQNPV